MSTEAAEAPALFIRDGDRFIPTVLAQGPWDRSLQFGGSPAALLATLLDDMPSLVPQQLARITFDLLRPVPLKPAKVDTTIRREGKKIQVLDASMTVDGEEVVRATALRMRLGEPDAFADHVLPAGEPRPESLRPLDGGDLVREQDLARQGFVPGIRYASDIVFGREMGWYSPQVWWRLYVPVIAGEPAKPIARLCFVADGTSGVGHPHAPDISGINADITVHIVRPPVSDWLCVEGTGWVSPLGIGHSNATISDAEGVSAAVLLSRLMSRI